MGSEKNKGSKVVTLSRLEVKNQIRSNRRETMKKFVTATGWTVVVGSAVVWLWHWTGG